MLRSPLSYQELCDYIYGVTSSLLEDDIPHLISTLQYHQDRLEGLTPIIESLTNEPRKCGFRNPTSWLPFPKRKKKVLDELRRREGDSYAAIAALRTLLSPIRRLPPELLTEIFIHCLPQKDFIPPNDAGTPLHLMQVCTRWREVCLSSPQLWTSIELVRPTTGQLTDNQRINHLKTSLLSLYVLQSGDLPLSLSIQDGLVSVGKIQTLLTVCIGRLKHLKIFIPEKHLCILPSGEYPRLESFEIRTPRGLQHSSVNLISTIMMRAPTLQKLTWKSINSPVFRPPPVECHWSTLTHLVLQATITMQHCMNILSLAVNARHLEFNEIFGLSGALPSPPIILPNLLSFTMNSQHDISQIFDALTLPHLTRLYVNAPLWPHTSIMGLFQRSRFLLQGLHLFYISLQEPQLIECLEHVQRTLMELTVQTDARVMVSDTLLDRLTNKGTGSVFCPCLRSLAFYSCVSCSPGGLARMVRSRIPGHIEGEGRAKEGVERVMTDSPSRVRVSPLQTVEIYASEPELAMLKPLRSLGLKLLAYSDEDMMSVDLDLDQPQ